jgi:hypothetical protein
MSWNKLIAVHHVDKILQGFDVGRLSLRTPLPQSLQTYPMT